MKPHTDNTVCRIKNYIHITSHRNLSVGFLIYAAVRLRFDKTHAHSGIRLRHKYIPAINS